MVNLEKVKNYAWIICLIAIILNIIALFIPNLVLISEDSYLFWLWNFYIIIPSNEFKVFELGDVGGSILTYIILGYIIAIVVIISIVLLVLLLIKSKKGTIGKLKFLWIIGGVVLLLMAIIGWGAKGIILFIEYEVFSIIIPLGSLLILISGGLTLTIGILFLIESRK
jgi:hypothetical protein